MRLQRFPINLILNYTTNSQSTNNEQGYNHQNRNDPV